MNNSFKIQLINSEIKFKKLIKEFLDLDIFYLKNQKRNEELLILKCFLIQLNITN